MSAIDVFGLLVPVTYLLMLGIEALFPARQFPPIPYWRLKGFCFLTVQGLLATLTPLVIPEHWLAAHRLINLEGLGVVGGEPRSAMPWSRWRVTPGTAARTRFR
jgi:hypothetical protein